MEFLDAAVAMGIFMAFVVAVLYISMGLESAGEAEQARLGVTADEALARILAVAGSPPTWGETVRELGLAYVGDPRVLDHRKLAALAAAMGGGAVCPLDPRLADAIGVDNATRLLPGLLLPPQFPASLDLASIKRSLFGGDWERYDFDLYVTPLLNMTVCFPGDLDAAGVEAFPANCRDADPGTLEFRVYPAVGRAFRGELTYRAYAFLLEGDDVSLYRLDGEVELVRMGVPLVGRADLKSGLEAVSGDGDIWDKLHAALREGRAALMVTVKTSGGLPRAMGYGVLANLRNDIVYAMPQLGPTYTRLLLIHSALVDCSAACDPTPGGGPPALGLRRIFLVDSRGSVYGMDANIVINPGRPELEPCNSCGPDGICRGACYVDLPVDTQLVFAYVTRNSASGGCPRSTVVVIPLNLDLGGGRATVETWRYWLREGRPLVEADVAERVATTGLVDYLVRLVLYSYP